MPGPETVNHVPAEVQHELQARQKRAIGNIALASGQEHKENEQLVEVGTLIADIKARSEMRGDAKKGEWFRFGDNDKTVRRITVLGSGNRIIETVHASASQEGEDVRFITETEVPRGNDYKVVEKHATSFLPNGGLVEVPYDMGAGNEGRVKEMIDIPVSDPRAQQSRERLHTALQAA